jgi:hypothetical protein
MTTGAGTLVGPVNTIGTGQRRVPDISFRSDGVLYGYGNSPDQLITINTATGQGTAVGPTGYGGGSGLDFAPNGTLYATPYDFQSLVIIDPLTGAGSDVPGSAGNVPFRTNALEFCQQSGVLYGSWNDKWGSGNHYLVTLDLNTGLPLTTVQTVLGLDAIAFNEFSRPVELLHEFVVDDWRVEMEQQVGMYDFCYQYYVDLEPEEVFWQDEFLDRTEDEIFWLSITAIYPGEPCEPQFPWGWQTRPWSWMDDAVRFLLHEEPVPGIVLDPALVEPIKDPVYGESFDVAFELDTDPNYIKWEQPFTGIRDWLHYHDEMSMAHTETVFPTKWVQYPDLNDINSIDVDATYDGWITWQPQILADDFGCTVTGPITGIHLWASWYHDRPPYLDVALVDFTLGIWSDDPCGPGGYSEPNEILWSQDFAVSDFGVSIWADSLMEGWYVPCEPYYETVADFTCYQYDFHIDPCDAFWQRGDPCNPVVYWLSVQARPVYEPWHEPIRFGWKTSYSHWKDDAVFAVGLGEIPMEPWQELRYPVDHPFAGESIDLAFEITTEEKEFYIDRLVADDWPCDKNTPITAATWWGSYIGYGYEACQDPPTASFMPLPVKPDYFLLNIWTDVPASSSVPPVSGDCCFEHGTPGCEDPICEASVCVYDPYCCGTKWDEFCAGEAQTDPGCECTEGIIMHSDPNEIVWEYRAYDYDEVLVGFDKHPHGEPNEPVFRYSVKLPREAWFFQDEPNDVYWFSVVAVYDQKVPDYNWGWTNHWHAYNNDAVEGYLDPPGGWFWTELFDQTGVSEDMSFILFTDPDPNLGTCWDPAECGGQICGDINCDGFVNFIDLGLMKVAFFSCVGDANYNCCADLNHDGCVNFIDLGLLKMCFFTGPWSPATGEQSCPPGY